MLPHFWEGKHRPVILMIRNLQSLNFKYILHACGLKSVLYHPLSANFTRKYHVNEKLKAFISSYETLCVDEILSYATRTMTGYCLLSYDILYGEGLKLWQSMHIICVLQTHSNYILKNFVYFCWLPFFLGRCTVKEIPEIGFSLKIDCELLQHFLETQKKKKMTNFE